MTRPHGNAPHGAQTPRPKPRLSTLDHVLLRTGGAVLLIQLVLDAPALAGNIGGWALLAPFLHWQGTLLVWSTLLALVVLTGRVWTPVAAMLVLAGALSVASTIKMSLLGEPMVATDVEFVTTPELLLAMVPRWTVPAAVLASGTVLWLGRRMDRRSRLTDALRPGRRQRIVAAVALTVLLASAAMFGHRLNPLRAAWDASGATWAAWSHADNLRQNGFLGALLWSLPSEAMERPDGYGPSTMSQITDRYTAAAAAQNADRVDHPWNIVLVLSESFADPDQIEGLELREDPLDSIRNVLVSSAHGQTTPAGYGTGTSTMEFQALTGQSIGLFSPQVISPYQRFVGETPSYPSAVDFVSRRGLRTVALHSFNDALYNRPEVYESLGFEKVIFDSDMTHVDRVEDNPFISDAATFDEVLDELTTSNDPVFAHVVTMQNHVPHEDWYSDPIEPRVGSNPDEIGTWARGIAHSSEALAGFIRNLEHLDEPTAVVYYGDHLPAIFDGLDVDGADAVQTRTPVMIWTNRVNRPIDLGVLGPQYLLPALYDTLELPEPPMFAFLDEMRHELGTVIGGSVLDVSGREIDVDALSERQRDLLEDYRLIQYDLSIGGRHAAEKLWSLPGAPAAD